MLLNMLLGSERPLPATELILPQMSSVPRLTSLDGAEWGTVACSALLIGELSPESYMADPGLRGGKHRSPAQAARDIASLFPPPPSLHPQHTMLL